MDELKALFSLLDLREDSSQDYHPYPYSPARCVCGGNPFDCDEGLLGE